MYITGSEQKKREVFMGSRIKRYVFEVIQPAEKGRIASKIFDLAIMALIAFSVASVFIATFDIPPKLSSFLEKAENWTLGIFSVEYLLRVWTADMLYPELGPIKSRLRYMRSGMAIIDLLAILPFFLPMFLPVNLLGIRALRLVRLLRTFKLNRYSDALISIGEVFRRKAGEIFASIFFVVILLVISSLLIYYAEHDAQPKQFANAFSGLWWAVATLTTVGYGDIYPVTAVGRLLGAVIAIMGIGMVAVPTGILSAGFVEILEKKTAKENGKEGGKDGDDDDEPPKYCPHCGKKL